MDANGDDGHCQRTRFQSLPPKEEVFEFLLSIFLGSGATASVGVIGKSAACLFLKLPAFFVATNLFNPSVLPK
jgi:hypothetical protein